MSTVLLFLILLNFTNFAYSSRLRNDGTNQEKSLVLCYWGAWALARPGLGSYGISQLRTAPCTHVVYSFIGLTDTGELTMDAELEVDGNSNTIADFISLKQENPELILLVAIGGWVEGSENFSTVCNNDTLRAAFVQNLYEFIQQHGFDGLDLDWEYPSQRGGAESDKEAFIWLIRDLKTAFEPRGWLLTAAVAVTQWNIDQSYDVPAMSELLDYINLMTYDYYGSWSEATGPNAPLFAQPGVLDDLLNVNASLNVWINNGADPSKLILGLASYGRSFTLSDSSNNGVGAPFVSPGAAGNFTNEAAFLAYYEICLDQQENPTSWSVTEVDDNYVYGNRDTFWVGYDNQYTIASKGAYAKQRGLGGIMFWAVDLDDFSGLCGTEYPMITSASRGWIEAPPLPVPGGGSSNGLSLSALFVTVVYSICAIIK